MADKTNGGSIEYTITATDSQIQVTLSNIAKTAGTTASSVSGSLSDAFEDANKTAQTSSESTANHSQSIWKTAATGIGNTLKSMGSSAWGMVKEVGIGALREIGAQSIKALQSVVSKISSLVKEGISYNAEIETYTNTFTRLTGSAEKADEIISKLKADSKGTQFDVSTLANATSMLMSAGDSAESAEKIVSALGEAIAATGGGTDEFSRMAANLQQVKNVGKATSMDIRQFAMAGINIYGILSDYTGKTVEQVKDMDVSYEVLSAALQKAASEGGRYYGASASQLKTYNGQITLLKTNVKSFFGAITKDAEQALGQTVLPYLNETIEKLQEAFENNSWEGLGDQLGKSLADIGNKISQALPGLLKSGANVIGSLVQGIKDNKSAIHDSIDECFAVLDEAWNEYGPDILGLGIELIGDLIEGIAEGLNDMANGTNASKWTKSIKDAFATIDWKGIATNLWDALWGAIKTMFNASFTVRKGSIADMVAQLFNINVKFTAAGSTTHTSSSGTTMGGGSSSFATNTSSAVSTSSSSTTQKILLNADLNVDGYKLGSVVLKNLDDAASGVLKK